MLRKIKRKKNQTTKNFLWLASSSWIALWLHFSLSCFLPLLPQQIFDTAAEDNLEGDLHRLSLYLVSGWNPDRVSNYRISEVHWATYAR